MSSVLGDFLLGTLSAGISKFLAQPFNNAKIVYQVQHYPCVLTHAIQPKFSNEFDALFGIPRRAGFSALFAGATINIVRYFPVQAFNFAFKDGFRSLFPT